MIKKDLITHITFFTSYFLAITLVKHYFSLSHIIFWLGAVVGLALPILDHIIYAYVLRPQEAVSERLRYMFKNNEFKNAIIFAISTRRDRVKLIFHTAYFQVLFFILAFLVITSSGSLFGRGLVLAFYLHLFIDQLIDYMEKGEISSWFREIPIVMDKQKTRIYILANVLTLSFLGFFL